MLLKSIISGANWKVSGHSTCHRKMALHWTSSALHLRKSLEVPSGNSTRCAHVPTAGNLFVSTCLPGEWALVDQSVFMALGCEGAAGSLKINFTFSKSQAGCLPRRVSTPQPRCPVAQGSCTSAWLGISAGLTTPALTSGGGNCAAMLVRV